jgi:hypothetical protein
MKSVYGSRWVAVVLLALTVQAVILMALSVDGVLRSLTVLIWVTACPGIALARRLGEIAGLALVVVGVALSLIMAQVLTAALMYLGVYSWGLVVAGLAVTTVACVSPDLRSVDLKGEARGT